MNVLIVVDMQRDFVDGVLGTPEAVAIVPAVKERIERAREAGEEVIFTRDTHTENYLRTQEGQNLPVVHCVRGTPGWEIIDELPVGDSLMIDKPTFGSTELGQYVAQKQPEHITLIGVCTDICVISNALLCKAYAPEIPITVEANCCAGVTPQSHDTALNAMRACQIGIV